MRWFHSGGIYAALSETTSELIIEAMKAAKASGAITSFDLNYRGKLWESMGGIDQAQATFKKIIEHVDVLIGNEEDLQLGLGVTGPNVEKKSKLDTSMFFQMMSEVHRDFPNVKMVATTMREVESANRHQWGAVVWTPEEQAISPTCELNVLDRIGGGDGFASGLIYGILDGRDLDQALRLGWAHGALSTTFPGDVTMARLAEVEAFASGGSARVQR